MIIYRAFAREAVRNTVAITLILTVVMGFLGITALLGRAVRGDVAQDIVMQMFGLQTLRRLDLLFTLGLYLGVLLTASRWYRDSEMTVLAACGIGIAQLLRPMFVMTAVAAVLISAVGFYFAPWAVGKMQQMVVEREQQRQPVTIAPGVFNETSGGTRIFYAERVSRDSGALGNVFISSLEKGRENVVVAHGGHPYVDEQTGDRFLALQDGTVYEGTPGQAGYRMIKFKILHVRIEPKAVQAPPPKVEALPTSEILLLGDPKSRAEWHWRLAKPLAAAVLAMFALVLAYTDPRRGRLLNLFAAILVYFIYSNVLVLGQTLIKKGHVPDEVGLWWVHAAMLGLVLYLFRQRVMNRPLLVLPRWGKR